MDLDPKEAQRRAAALEALRANAPPPPTEIGSFWRQHGAKVMLIAGLVLGLWIVSHAVGSFVRTSIDETRRAEEELRRGLKR